MTAALFYWVWTAHPGWVDKADSDIVNAYTGRFDKQILDIENLIARQKYGKARQGLTELKARLGNVRKEDRLAGVYGKTLELELTLDRLLGRQDYALTAARALVDFNQLHYRYWLEYGRELAKLPDRQDEAIKAMDKAFRIAPFIPSVAETYASFLYGINKKPEARDVVRYHLDATRVGPVQLFMKDETGDFSQGRSMIAPSYMVSQKPCTIVFDTKTRRIESLRFDPPPIPEVVTEITSFKITTDTGAEEDIASKRPDGMYNVVEMGRNVYRSTTDDPAIVYTVTRYYNTRVESVKVTLRSRPCLTPELERILQDKG